MREFQLPQPGELIGWAIFYGDKREHVTAIVAHGTHDQAYADQRAADLRGVIVPMLAGAL